MGSDSWSSFFYEVGMRQETKAALVEIIKAVRLGGDSNAREAARVVERDLLQCGQAGRVQQPQTPPTVRLHNTPRTPTSAPSINCAVVGLRAKKQIQLENEATRCLTPHPQGSAHGVPIGLPLNNWTTKTISSTVTETARNHANNQ